MSENRKVEKNPLLALAAWAARWMPAGLKRQIYRIQPLARVVRGGLKRAAPLGLTPVKIAAGGLAGWQMILDMQKEKAYWLGAYEPELQAAVEKWIKPGAVVYDIGANIGFVSLLAARRVGESGRVYAFEALPENLERLKANLALNGVSERVEVIPAAVVECARPVRFLIGPSGAMGKAEGSAGRHEVTYAHSVDVPGISIDQFLFDGGPKTEDGDRLPSPVSILAPQVIKMDIEGGEILALPGMQRVLKEIRPILLLELHGPESGQAAWTALNLAGYRICRMQDGYPAVTSLLDLDWKSYLVGIPDFPGEDNRGEGNRGESNRLPVSDLPFHNPQSTIRNPK